MADDNICKEIGRTNCAKGIREGSEISKVHAVTIFYRIKNKKTES